MDKETTTEEKTKMEKTAPKSTRESRKKGAEDGRKRKDKYLEIKSFALAREDKNFSKLFVIHEKDNWWKMVGNSAIIFHYEIAKRIGMSSKLVADTDFECVSEDGVVNIKSIHDLDLKLDQNKIRLLDVKEEYRIYNLGQKYTASDIERMKKTKELEWGKVNSIVLPKDIHPLLFKSERELLLFTYNYTKKFDSYAREKFGNPLVDRASWMIREYSAMANGYGMEPETYFRKVALSTQWMVSEMTIISELRLLEPDKIFRLLKAIENTRKDAERCLKRLKAGR